MLFTTRNSLYNYTEKEGSYKIITRVTKLKVQIGKIIFGKT